MYPFLLKRCFTYVDAFLLYLRTQCLRKLSQLMVCWVFSYSVEEKCQFDFLFRRKSWYTNISKSLTCRSWNKARTNCYITLLMLKFISQQLPVVVLLPIWWKYNFSWQKWLVKLSSWIFKLQNRQILFLPPELILVISWADDSMENKFQHFYCKIAAVRSFQLTDNNWTSTKFEKAATCYSCEAKYK